MVKAEFFWLRGSVPQYLTFAVYPHYFLSFFWLCGPNFECWLYFVLTIFSFITREISSKIFEILNMKNMLFYNLVFRFIFWEYEIMNCTPKTIDQEEGIGKIWLFLIKGGRFLTFLNRGGKSTASLLWLRPFVTVP